MLKILKPSFTTYQGPCAVMYIFMILKFVQVQSDPSTPDTSTTDFWPQSPKYIFVGQTQLEIFMTSDQWFSKWLDMTRFYFSKWLDFCFSKWLDMWLRWARYGWNVKRTFGFLLIKCWLSEYLITYKL